MQPLKTSLFVLMGLLFLPGCGSTQNEATAGLLENKVPGTATLSGKITAPSAFEAARVYAQNVDKNIIYMVYTGDGNYQAVAMFPGNGSGADRIVGAIRPGMRPGDVAYAAMT